MILNENTSEMIQDNDQVMSNAEAEICELYLRKIGGFNLLFNRPLIAKNQKYLFVICDRNIRKYIIENGNFMDEYHFGSNKQIISIQQSDNDEEILVSFEDGRIICWNYEENYKVFDTNIKINPEYSISYLRKVNNFYYFILKRYKKKHPIYQLFYCSIGQMDNIKPADETYFEDINQKSFAFGPRENINYCAIVYKHLLYVYQIPFTANSKKRMHLMTTRKYFTTVDFHPYDNIIATGDEMGQIFIWNDIMALSPTKTILHWHSDRVSDLAFSAAGNCLYSVGTEMVLVKWNLVGQNYGEKNFVPRIGSKIEFVTVDPENKFVITSHVDQCLQIIDTQFNGIRNVFDGLRLCIGQNGKFSTGLHFNFKLNALALNGQVGHVQFYCPSRQKQLFQFDIAEQNVICGGKIGQKRPRKRPKILETDKINRMYPIEVTKLAVSQDGDWMATVEYRNDHETSPEMRLKFWQLKNLNGFHLNTTVHLPHNNEINFIQFSPMKEDGTFHLVTTSYDTTFKIWDLNSNDDNKWWNCSRTGSLNDQSIPRLAAFSSDASLITVLFDTILTLWELDSPNNIRYIPRMDIFNDYKNHNLLFLSFGHGKLSHYLIQGMKKSVTVRNVIKHFENVFTFKNETNINSISYNSHENILALISAIDINFLCLTQQMIVARINFSNIKNFNGKIIHSTFDSFNRLKAKVFRKGFYCLNEQNELFEAIFDDNCKSLPYDRDCQVTQVGLKSEKTTELFIKRIENGKWIFQSLMIKDKINSNAELKLDKQTMIDSKKATKNLVDKFFFETPAHVLPPVNAIEKSFLTSYFECLGLGSSTTSNNSFN